MSALCVDVETSTHNNGAPYDRRNTIVCYSWADETSAGANKVTSDSIEILRDKILGARVLIGHNIKFDIHWLNKIGIEVPEICRVHDTQTGEFILSRQTERYPSLEDALVRHDLGHKLDVVKTEYWAKGIQTEDVPWPILEEYAIWDAKMTLALYHKQQELLTQNQKRLVNLMGMDLLILQTMEKNGLVYDEELCHKRAEEIKGEIQRITEKLSSIYPNVPINFGSGDQLSAFLYGGTIVEEGKEHIGFFKSGARVGEPKYKNIEILHELPRLVTPLRGSELKKEGFWATNQDTLLKLKGNKATKAIIELIQRQVRLDTLLSKTYEGIIKVNREQMWEPGVLHGQLNQCVAVSGRLSASKPNQQNFDGEAADLFVSRYSD